MKNSKIYPWIVVALLWVVALLNYLDRQMLSTMQESMKMDIKELAVGENFGRLMGVFLLIYGLMSPVAGIIADRVNRKWMIVGSLFVWSAVTYGMGYATTFNQVYWLRALMGLSEALYLATALSMIADYHTSKTRSLAIGIHMSGLYAGQALGGFGATIASNYTWHTVFHWFGMVGIVYAFFLVFTLFIKNPKHKQTTQTTPPRKNQWCSRLPLWLAPSSFWLRWSYLLQSAFPAWGLRNWCLTSLPPNLNVPMPPPGPLAPIPIAISPS